MKIYCAERHSVEQFIGDRNIWLLMKSPEGAAPEYMYMNILDANDKYYCARAIDSSALDTINSGYVWAPEDIEYVLKTIYRYSKSEYTLVEPIELLSTDEILDMLPKE